ncbi:neuronal acetylcholine receptor subunit alpha-3-like [Ylistrum balloti]|uniref:neuronal acetylcholine receptor subunit alpha-3-like n=1 Tax=Ylistrum balloti TaxID=509963 RepID=UPI002905B917|nr:neuronal acetylcholine receptor subunit alpha-3-like [Ylistrum balloti]
MVRVLVPYILLLTFASRTDTSSISDANALFNNLSSGYNKEVRPVGNQGDSLPVYINMFLISIKDFDEVSGTLSILAVFVINWNDASLVWNPSLYGGLLETYIGQNNVWLPKLYNIKASNTFSAISNADFLVKISNDGEIIWKPGCFIDVKCSTDVSYFPFDTQTCSIQLAPWGYSNLQVTLMPQTTDLSLEFYETNGEWSLDKTKTGTDVISDISLAVFNITITRLPAFHIVNTLMPIYLLLLMNPLVFMLPCDSGERVGFSLTVFLTFTVFITIVNSVLPANSESMSRLSYFIFAVLVASGIIASVNIFQLRIYYRDENIPVPRWLVRFMNILDCQCKSRRVSAVIPKKIEPKSSNKNLNKTGPMIQMEEDTEEETKYEMTWHEVVRILDTFFIWSSYTVITACGIVALLLMYKGT